MTFELQGRYNDATVHTVLSKSESEEEAVEQIQKMVDHEAFTGDSDVEIMSDFHWGAGAVIGFTMPVKNRICPNTIGVDIGCFHPDTIIDTISGEEKIEDLANSNESFGVYSCDEDGNIKIGEATAMKTRTDSALVEVVIDNGESIKCTPDHEFMLRNGKYKEAQDLANGDSLMPLYKGETDDGYTLVYDNNKNESYGKREHWMVARSDLMDIPKGVDDMVIHHKDFDKKNNSPRNLEFMSRIDHSKLHAELGSVFDGDNGDFEEKRLAMINKYWENISSEELQKRKDIAIENITSWMDENPDEFEEAVSDNGCHGKEYLVDFNTSQRSCKICEEEFENPAQEYWHEVKDHPNETEYSVRENHSVESVTKIDETSDVYCLNVPEYGNFALSAGVIVHNCGMYAMNLGQTGHDWNEEQVLHTVDKKIRDNIPLGYDVHNRGDYHMYNDFPWELCQEKLDAFVENSEFDSIDVEYSGEYFSDLCKRVGYDSTRAIDSVGTLGGGNHFIEIGQDSSSDTWVIIHSGSRGIGAETAQHWQDKATSLTTRRQNIEDVPTEVRAYMTEEWKPKADKIREDFDGEAIQDKFNLVSQAIQKYGPSAANRDTDLDYLEGEEAHGYVTDMIFAQTYASESRKEMADAVAEVLNASPQDGIESVHNYIDFRDAVIRKGACRAHDGERLVIPFNIEYGTLICEGLGSEEWNNSAPHGAGRQMSRTGAKSQFSDEDFTAQTDSVYTSSRPIDEIPGAYKPPEEIESAIGETATVVDRVKPVLNIKDD